MSAFVAEISVKPVRLPVSPEGLGQGDSHTLHKLVQPVRASGKRDRHDVSSRDGQRGNIL
jgi:hypothetical protein